MHCPIQVIVCSKCNKYVSVQLCTLTHVTHTCSYKKECGSVCFSVHICNDPKTSLLLLCRCHMTMKHIIRLSKSTRTSESSMKTLKLQLWSNTMWSKSFHGDNDVGNNCNRLSNVVFPFKQHPIYDTSKLLSAWARWVMICFYTFCYHIFSLSNCSPWTHSLIMRSFNLAQPNSFLSMIYYTDG